MITSRPSPRPRGRFASLLLLLAASLAPGAALAQEPICAEVKIEILQKVSMERQAFDAVLRINNGLDGLAVEDLRVDVRFQDEAGVSVRASSDPNDTSAAFFLRLDATDGIDGGVGGAGRVAPRTSGEARWLIIPSAGAGGELPSGRIYRVGATVSYRLGEEATEVDVTPEAITVRPQPRLALDYFLPREVFSDDPFTPDVEPEEPFTLGVRVANVGFGEARRVAIESGQPRIVENEQGLLVDFRILGSAVGDQAGDPSLAVALGDIPAGSQQVARWRMATTLNGRFVEFDARYSHAPELGGALTTLLERVTTHTLVGDVVVDLAGRDGVADFLALDGDVLRVYESDGTDTPVEDASERSAVRALGGGRLEFDLPALPGMAYARLRCPGGMLRGQVSATRADGTPLPAGNAWLSREQSLVDQSYTCWVNLFDARPGTRYTLVVGAAPAASSLAGDVRFDANGDGLDTPDEPGVAGVVVHLDGTGADGFSVLPRQATTDAGGGFRFDDLPAGTYVLRVAGFAGSVDGRHAPGAAGGIAAGDGIRAIVLAPGTQALDYRLRKRPKVADDGADVQATLAFAQTPRRTTDPVEVLLTLRNAGPRAASDIEASLAWPEALVVESVQADEGTVDASSGRWRLAALPTGEQRVLRLRGRFSRPGLHRFEALALERPGAGFDPDEANNGAALELALDPWSLRGEAIVWPRLLVLAPCVRAELADAGQRACETVAEIADARRMEDWLASRPLAGLAVHTSGESFASALATGEWDSAWLRAAPALSAATIDDLRMALARGETLLVDAEALAAADAGLRTLLGVADVQVRAPGLHAVVVAEGGDWPAGVFTRDGAFATLVPGQARVLATFNGHTGAAATEHRLGRGRAIALGIDLVDSRSPALLDAISRPLGAALEPQARGWVEVGGLQALGAELGAGLQSQPVELALRWPGADAALVAMPATPRLEATQVAWHEQVAAGAVIGYRGLFRASRVAGASVAVLEGRRSDAGVWRSLGEHPIAVRVLDLEALGVEASRAILALEDAGDAANAARDAAHEALAEALAYADLARPMRARMALREALDKLQAHPLAGATRDEAMAAIGGLHELLRRDAADEACTRPDPGVFDGEGFVGSTPAQGLAIGGVLANRGAWISRLGRLDAFGPDQVSLRTFSLQGNAEMRFELERDAQGQAVLRLFRDGRLVLRQVQSLPPDADALGLRASLGSFLPPAYSPGAALAVHVDSIDGQPVDASLQLRLADRGGGSLYLAGRGQPTLRVTGRIRPSVSLLPLGLPYGELRLAAGRVECEVP